MFKRSLCFAALLLSLPGIPVLAQTPASPPNATASPAAALSPAATVVGQFFEAVYVMDYLKAWHCLTPKSQEQIIELIQKSEDKLSAAEIRQLFEQADRSVMRGFWSQLRQSIGIEVWRQQRFENGPAGASAQEAFVNVSPAGLQLYARQDQQGWKFGYTESFVERLSPPQR